MFPGVCSADKPGIHVASALSSRSVLGRTEVENPLYAFRWRHRRGVAAKAPAKLGKMFVNAYI